MGWIKNMIKKWLGITPAGTGNDITIKEVFTFEQNAMRSRLWYLGDPYMLSQFFKGVKGDTTNSGRFWAIAPADGFIRKIHTGIPSRIIDKLTDIVISDLEGVQFVDENGKELTDEPKNWTDICKENSFDGILTDALSDIALIGDGAFKLIADSSISKHPIIQWVPGERVEYLYKYKRLYGVVFFTHYRDKNNKLYELRETYTAGHIKYALYDDGGKEVQLNALQETAGFTNVSFNSSLIFARPVFLKKSKQYSGRGAGLFEGKSDSFDALDESISQWIDALRAGRTREYIPNNLLTDEQKKSNSINPILSRYVEIDRDAGENAKNQISTTNAPISASDYLTTHITLLDNALQGIISPSTLGIDVKKLDNAEAQREKEKTTLYTRQKLIDVLQTNIPELIKAALVLDDLMNYRGAGEYSCTLKFGEYANPSFEAVVETVSKAAPGKTVISPELWVEELWGKDLKDDEKKAEVSRLYAINNPTPTSGYFPEFSLGSRFDFTTPQNNNGQVNDNDNADPTAE